MSFRRSVLTGDLIIVVYTSILQFSISLFHNSLSSSSFHVFSPSSSPAGRPHLPSSHLATRNLTSPSLSLPCISAAGRKRKQCSRWRHPADHLGFASASHTLRRGADGCRGDPAWRSSGAHSVPCHFSQPQAVPRRGVSGPTVW